MISVIIPLYNKAQSVKGSIDSVLAQTFQDYEIVVVDDGSTDDSATVVEAIADPRIRLIRQDNAGVSAARNRGIAEAKGEYVAFLDADDSWKPDFLETMMSLVEKYPQCDVFAVNYEMHDADGNVKNPIINRLPFDTENGELINYFEVAACSHPPLWTSAVMVRRDAIDSVGGFPHGIKSGEDLLTWARLACKYKIAYTRKSLAVFNIEGYSHKEKPKRIPMIPDVVGNELRRLHTDYECSGLNEYIAMWHKMRANIFFRLGDRRKAISESITGVRWDPFNFKLYIYLIMCFLPKKLLPF